MRLEELHDFRQLDIGYTLEDITRWFINTVSTPSKLLGWVKPTLVTGNRLTFPVYPRLSQPAEITRVVVGDIHPDLLGRL